MKSTERQPAPESSGGALVPSLWPYLLLCAIAAAWIDLGSLHRRHHSDSLIPALVSLYRWTPFYWELDRIGMLVPLIARPIRHPLLNLLFQDGIYLFCALSSLVLLPRYLFRNASYPFASVLSMAAFVALTPGYYRFEYLIDTQYGVWLFLGLSSLIVLEPSLGGRACGPRRLAATALMILAHWVYCTAALFLGPLIVFRVICQGSLGAPSAFKAANAAKIPPAKTESSTSRDHAGWRRAIDFILHTELGCSLAVLALGFCSGLGLMQLAPAHHSDFASLPLAEWAPTWRSLMASTWTSLAPQWWPWFLLAAAAAGLAGLCFSSARSMTKANGRAAAAALAAAIAIALFMGTRHWVAANKYEFRFLLPSALMIQAALLGIAAAPLAAICRMTTRWSGAVALTLILGAATWSYGWPSLQSVYSDLDSYYDSAATATRPGIGTRELLEHHCTHVAGDYWTVWPAVFRANLALYERGERRVVWGIGERCGPTHRYWSAIPRDGIRVAIAAGGDAEAGRFLDAYGVTPLAVAERHDTLWLLRPAELLTAEGATEALAAAKKNDSH